MEKQVKSTPMYYIIVSLFSFLFLSACNKKSPQFTANVEKIVLDNGITVLLDKNTSPVTAIYSWYKVGAKNEDPNRTGLAHFFEHLMFKKTPVYEDNYISKLMAKIGGRSNAFTTQDSTAYYETVPFGKNIEDILKYEAHRMQNLELTQEDIDIEVEVVKEEFRMRVGNSLYGQIFNTLIPQIYKNSNYRWATIGSLEHLDQTTREEFLTFYKKHYRPKNMTLVISGNFDKLAVNVLIKKYFEVLKNPSLDIKDQPWVAEKRDRRPEVLIKETNFKSQVLTLSFLSVSENHSDQMYLDVLSQVLCEGNSSRLFQELVFNWKNAQSVSCFQYALQNEGAFIVQVPLNPGASWEEAKDRVLKVFDSFKASPITDLELQKARNSVELDVIEYLQKSQSRARALAQYEVIKGDYKIIDKEYNQILKLKKEDFGGLMTKYFTTEKANVLVFKPAIKPEAQPDTKLPSKSTAKSKS